MKMRYLAVATGAALLSLSAVAGGERQSQSGTEDRTEAQAIQDATTVRQAQERLRAEGYAATPDGLKEFQQAKGISPSGKLDQRTLAALGVGASASGGETSERETQPSEGLKN